MIDQARPAGPERLVGRIAKHFCLCALAYCSRSLPIVDGVPIEYLQASWKVIPEEQRAAFETQVRALYKQMARITLRPEWAKLIDFETRLPIAIQHLVSGR